jgi:hypothetical protein
VTNDGCRDPRAIRPAAALRGLPRGATSTYVLRHAGQPHTRLASTFGYCAKSRSGSTVRIKVVFGPSGRLRRVV